MPRLDEMIAGQPRAVDYAALQALPAVQVGRRTMTGSAWADLMLKSQCWTSRGVWQRSQPRLDHGPEDIFVWQPECPTPLPRATRAEMCDQLAASWPDVFVIGDSISGQAFMILMNFLGGSFSSSLLSAEQAGSALPKSKGQLATHKMATTMFSGVACGGRVRVEFRRNDRLLVDGDPRSGSAELRNFYETPFTTMLRNTNGLILLNRGAHFESDPIVMQQYQTIISHIRSIAPASTIVVRSTAAGHDQCTASGQPVAAPADMSHLAGHEYHWQDFPRQNARVMSMIANEMRGVLLLDLEYMTALRPDGHLDPPRDCVHYGRSSFDVYLGQIDVLAAMLAELK